MPAESGSLALSPHETNTSPVPANITATITKLSDLLCYPLSTSRTENLYSAERLRGWHPVYGYRGAHALTGRRARSSNLAMMINAPDRLSALSTEALAFVACRQR
jgi:hypothetical protein